MVGVLCEVLVDRGAGKMLALLNTKAVVERVVWELERTAKVVTS